MAKLFWASQKKCYLVNIWVKLLLWLSSMQILGSSKAALCRKNQSLGLWFRGFWMIVLFHWRFFLIFLTQAVSSFVFCQVIKGTQYADSLITNFSFLSILNLIYPSKVTQAPVLASWGNTIVILAVLGRIIGRKLSEWGQIGVRATTSAVGWIIDPPQDRL